jgi:hypothetical protein
MPYCGFLVMIPYGWVGELWLVMGNGDCGQCWKVVVMVVLVGGGGGSV